MLNWLRDTINPGLRQWLEFGKADLVQDIVNPRMRQWEDFYRNRWQYDKAVRSTHGVNCTGGCSWMVYVKDGIVTWEMQALDYPQLEAGLPSYQPRGCQRGIVTSWYIYSPIRVKYPYWRGALVDLWRQARSEHADPVDAWASIMQNEERRRTYQEARGKGGFRRASWDEVLELIAASTIYTIKKYGPDRIIGFTPIPGMSMVSYASGIRFLQLLGGVALSFYDWYADLPPAFPEVFGEQTDVAESADWYNSRYIAVMGSNLNMTRTPDVHFACEARYAGAKLVVLSPDFSQVSKYADWWIPVKAGEDAAFWLAVDHVILKEFYVDRQVPFFLDYLKRYTDAPFLVTLEAVEPESRQGAGPRTQNPEPRTGGPDPTYRAGRLLRAASLDRYRWTEKGDWKFLVFDRVSQEPRMPQGTVGFRWQDRKGQWNLQMKDGLDGTEIDPELSFRQERDALLPVLVADMVTGKPLRRGVPVRYVETGQGPLPVATIHDLMMAQFGVGPSLPGEYPDSYDDESAPYTPAWQEKFTGIDRNTVIGFAREWASTAEKTEGKCTVIIGTGVNQWYYTSLIYRSAITALMLCGCVGRNGGGLNHYVGQEKVGPIGPWTAISFALDWLRPPRQQNSPSFFYVHTDQWRYDPPPISARPSFREGEYPFTEGRSIDLQARAVRMGWLPSYPQFNRNPIEIVREAEAAGARSEQEIVDRVVRQLRAGVRGESPESSVLRPEGGAAARQTPEPRTQNPELQGRPLRFAVQDPDAPENWPRLWFIWRGNALMSSAKGHEYFLKHFLGTHSNTIADEVDGEYHGEVRRRNPAPTGKLDLVVDINFRMDTTATYSDIVLPAATWYEKDDLNTTDLHSYIHPLTAAVPPCWESRSDWDIFKAIAGKVSDLARTHLPGTVREIVAVPLQHDTPDEVAQPEVKDWARGECDPIPGKTMPKLVVVERDYVNLRHRLTSLGPLVREHGISLHGVHWPLEDVYDDLLRTHPKMEWGGRSYPSMQEGVDAANMMLHLAPETNGEMAYRSFKDLEEKTGTPLADLAEGYRGVRHNFADLIDQPRRFLTSPCWSGITNDGRAYAGFCINVERRVPWRTLTGRLHFYLDHQGYLAFGEALPTYKPKPTPEVTRDLTRSQPVGQSLVLNLLTPHGKWHIHTTFSDTQPMLTLSRGVEPLWLNDRDAEEIGVGDNDWVEVHNDNGVVVTRAVVSARIPRGVCIEYHAQERTIEVPRSPLRGGRRAGADNSLTRVRLQPTLMMGGYGHLTYSFNYWGPTGVNRDSFVLVHRLDGPPRW